MLIMKDSGSCRNVTSLDKKKHYYYHYYYEHGLIIYPFLFNSSKTHNKRKVKFILGKKKQSEHKISTRLMMKQRIMLDRYYCPREPKHFWTSIHNPKNQDSKNKYKQFNVNSAKPVIITP